MNLFRMVIITLMIIISSASLHADGKFYTGEKVPPELPYQRAIMSYQDGEELLILQSKFKGQGKHFGWVIPLPNPPKIGTIVNDSERGFFWWLSNTTQPNVSHYFHYLLLFFPLALALLIIIRMYYLVTGKPVPPFWQVRVGKPNNEPPSPFLSTKVRPVITVLIIFCVIVIIAAIAIPNLLSFRGVEILKQGEFGIYDIKVVKSSDSKELITWLNKNKYKFTSADEAVFNSYIAKDWCFVTVHIKPRKTENTWFGVMEDLPDPLVLTFKSKELVYPLSLTAVSEKETEILLYVLGNHCFQTDKRFEREFADKIDLPRMEVTIESPDNADMNSFPHSYLTKFRGKLSPEQMKNDLIITTAKDDKPYKKHIWKW
jgi:hypothetical protein